MKGAVLCVVVGFLLMMSSLTARADVTILPSGMVSMTRADLENFVEAMKERNLDNATLTADAQSLTLVTDGMNALAAQIAAASSALTATRTWLGLLGGLSAGLAVAVVVLIATRGH